MGTQGPGRKRLPNAEKLTAEDDALKQIAREAEARLAARRTARAEAREIRMKELEKQNKEKYYGLDYKWGHIEQWMEDGERYSRHSRRIASLSDDEERMSVGSRGSLKPSDYSSFLGSGSRASSRASSARASPVVEERLDRDFLDRGSRPALNLSAATLSSLGGASSRRGSCDTSISVEMEASIREMKDSVAEAEEKYRRAMVSNAQLHNDKSTLMYQVETLREELSDMEELLWEARRHADERTKAYERERDCHIILQFQFKEMKETMRRSEELLMQHGEVISPEVATNGGPRLDEAEDEVSSSFDSRLAEEAPGTRESILGNTRDMTSHQYQINKPLQSLSFSSAGKHERASDMSRERKQMDQKGRRKDQMRTFPARLKRNCVPVNRGKQTVKENANSDLELTLTPKVKSMNEARLSTKLRKSQAKCKKSISHVYRTSMGKVHKSGQPASGFQQHDFNHSTGQKMNKPLAQCFSTPTVTRENVAVVPSCSTSPIREDCEDLPAMYEQKVIENASEKCETPHEEADHPNMSDFVIVDSAFAEDATSAEDLRTVWPRSSAASAAVGQSFKFRSLIEEIKVMAAPEWVLMKLPEGKRFSQILETNMPATQEPSVADMDSCEEAHEEMEQQAAASGWTQPRGTEDH
ncbi:uncharacterized protein lrrfip1b isoform X9 [Festucalex cinctus]